MRLAACLYVRDEAHDIAEWLAFHHVVGFDHVLVFDNGSVDGTRAIVRRASRYASIRLLPWPITDKRAQKGAYAVALHLLRGFDWVAFIDADEFLTPTTDRPIKVVLGEISQAAAVTVNWAMFGSNGRADSAPGRLVESFTSRARDDFPENRLVKSIVRPRLARAENPHRFVVNGACVRPDGRPMAWERDDRCDDSPDYGLLQVSHYFTRSRAHWRRKMARGYRDIVRPQEAFAQYDRNEVEDLSTARFAPAVHAELVRRGQA